jgi:hypothetical protein
MTMGLRRLFFLVHTPVAHQTLAVYPLKVCILTSISSRHFQALTPNPLFHTLVKSGGGKSASPVPSMVQGQSVWRTDLPKARGAKPPYIALLYIPTVKIPHNFESLHNLHLLTLNICML